MGTLRGVPRQEVGRHLDEPTSPARASTTRMASEQGSEGPELKERIRSWMIRVVQERTDVSFDDLHIDEIIDRFRDRAAWVDGAVECLQVAALIRNSEQWPFTIAVGFSLRSNPAPSGLGAVRQLELTSEVDDSPPSLYLFEQGNEPWKTDEDFHETPIECSLRVNIQVRTFLREWRDENDGDFRRSFWLAA